MDVQCLCMCVFLCLCTATSWSPAQGVLPTVYDSEKNTKWNGEFHGRRPRPTGAVVPMKKKSIQNNSIDIFLTHLTSWLPIPWTECPLSRWDMLACYDPIPHHTSSLPHVLSWPTPLLFITI
jgi:hypothetical protein